MCAEGAVVGLCGQWGVTEFLPASLFLSADKSVLSAVSKPQSCQSPASERRRRTAGGQIVKVRSLQKAERQS